MTKKKHTSNPTDNATVEIKNYPASLIHDHTSEDGSVFHSLSFRWMLGHLSSYLLAPPLRA